MNPLTFRYHTTKQGVRQTKTDKTVSTVRAVRAVRTDKTDRIVSTVGTVGTVRTDKTVGIVGIVGAVGIDGIVVEEVSLMPLIRLLAKPVSPSFRRRPESRTDRQFVLTLRAAIVADCMLSDPGPSI